MLLSAAGSGLGTSRAPEPWRCGLGLGLSIRVRPCHLPGAGAAAEDVLGMLPVLEPCCAVPLGTEEGSLQLELRGGGL